MIHVFMINISGNGVLTSPKLFFSMVQFYVKRENKIKTTVKTLKKSHVLLRSWSRIWIHKSNLSKVHVTTTLFNPFRNNEQTLKHIIKELSKRIPYNMHASNS
jgi:hypothetical protein